MQRVGFGRQEGHRALRIGERLVELALLRIAPGAAVERGAMVGLRRQHLLVVGDGAVDLALVVEDGGAVDHRIDIVGRDAERLVVVGERAIEINQ